MELYELLRLAIAIVLATLVAHPIIYRLIRPMVKTVEHETIPRYEALAEGFGNVERMLYVCAFSLNQPTFIVAWLGLKVAVKWHSWTVPKGATKDEGQYARAQYLLFLYGSGVSALAALFSFMLAKPMLDFLVYTVALVV